MDMKEIGVEPELRSRMGFEMFSDVLFTSFSLSVTWAKCCYSI